MKRLSRLGHISSRFFIWATMLACPAWSAAQPGGETQSKTGNMATGTAEARFGLKFPPVDFSPPAVNHTQLPNGITVDHFAEPGIPLVTLLARFHVGSVHDPADKVGAAAMTAEVIRNGGSTNLGGDELDRQLEDRGAQLSVETTREETWFRLSVLREDLDWGVQTLQDLLLNPAFPSEKLDEARGRQLVDLQQRLDVPMSVARALFPQLVYGKGNPWGWTVTSRSAQALTVDDLKFIYQQYYRVQNLKLGLSGDLTGDEARRVTGDTFGKLPKGEPAAPATPAVEPVKKTTVYIVPRKVSQNVIYFGHEGIGRFDPDKFAVKVFNNVLSGGFTSRLFKEVRSNRGLAYSVYGQLTEGTAKGVFACMAMTKTASADETMQLMMKIVNELRREPPTAVETDLAKQSDINSFVFFFDLPEKIVRQKMTLDAFGYPGDYLATYVPNLKSVTPEEVRAAADKNLHPDRVVILIIGQIPAEMRKNLSDNAEIVEISEQELREQWL